MRCHDTADVHDNDPCRLRRDLGAQALHIDGERLRVAIHEPRDPAGMQDAECRGKEGVGRNEHLLPAHVIDMHGDLDRARAAVHDDRVFCADERREFILKLFAVLTEGQLAGGQDLIDPLW